jgi:hypothetical protein
VDLCIVLSGFINIVQTVSSPPGITLAQLAKLPGRSIYLLAKQRVPIAVDDESQIDTDSEKRRTRHPNLNRMGGGFRLVRGVAVLFNARGHLLEGAVVLLCKSIPGGVVGGRHL